MNFQICLYMYMTENISKELNKAVFYSEVNSLKKWIYKIHLYLNSVFSLSFDRRIETKNYNTVIRYACVLSTITLHFNYNLKKCINAFIISQNTFLCLFYRKCLFQAHFPVLQCSYSCFIWLQTLGKDFKLQKHQKFWCTKPWVALHKLNIMQFYKYCYFLLLLKALLILKQLELKHVEKKHFLVTSFS